MNAINRREFLEYSGKMALAAGAASTLAIDALGANDRIVVGLMGAGGRGTQLAEWFAARPDVEVAYVADPDKSRAETCANRVGKVARNTPATTQDFRRMLEDKRVDAIINATRITGTHSAPYWPARPGRMSISKSRLVTAFGKVRR